MSKGHRSKKELAAQKVRLVAKLAKLEGKPLPAPDDPPTAANSPVVASLAGFLESVAATRATFAARRQDGITVTLDTGGHPYKWAADDFAARAQQFALAGKDDTVHTGEWMRKSCLRFLNDLDTGASRGLWFDPAAARDVCRFAETYCGIKLMPWQVFILANLYGWKRVLGQRRFTEAWTSCAKKNGKTRLASVIGLWGLICDGEKYPSVFSAATKKDQAKIVWRDARRAVEDNEELRSYVKRWAGSLAVEGDGEFEPLASEEQSLDGLRPSTIIGDEIAFWGTKDQASGREQWDKLSKGVVNRTQPLIFCITTAGNRYRSFAWNKFDLGEKILNGVIADDTTFVAIFSVDKDDDHLHNEECWAKANPSLGVTLQIEHLRKIRDEVLVDATGLPAWIQYHTNRWAEKDISEQATISLARWDECTRLDLIPEARDPMHAYELFMKWNAGKHVWVGLDLGKTSDMTAIAFLWRAGHLKPHVRDNLGNIKVWADDVPLRFLTVLYLMPEAGIGEKEKRWGVPLHTWVKEGWIKTTPGDLIDDSFVEQVLRNSSQQVAIHSLGFDRWQAETICGRLTGEKVIECAAVPQIPSSLTTPAREFLGDIRRGNIVHFGNPVLKWNIENVVLAEDENHGIKPRKAGNDETRKIDGVSATINAYAVMLKAPAPISPRVFSL